ncbi:MAG: eukaryotic-like serine/threonine-protein kinase [Chthoniobacter sp.]|jgi:hypothetical protein|nr:eukaryotic-like serine/threonine-protein kinase [Chthoniobacter sp.]
MSHLTERFDLQTRIAIGNAGLVYRATDKVTRRKLALKLLPGDDLAHPLNGEALVRDVAQLQRISGNNIAQLLEIIEDEAGVVLVYEFAEGPNWVQAAAERKLDPAEALDVSAQLLSALAIGESLRRPHGEIKPSNLVLSQLPDGRLFVWVLDWGLSAYRPEPPPDSLLFLAPEQLEGGASSIQGDLFAAGASLFYLLTGRAAVTGHQNAEVRASWKQFSPNVLRKQRPDLRPKFLRWLASLLEVDPRKRPGTVDQAMQSLAELKPPSAPVLPEIFRARAERALPDQAETAAAVEREEPSHGSERPTPFSVARPAPLPATQTVARAPLPTAPRLSGKRWSVAVVAALAVSVGAWLFLHHFRIGRAEKPGRAASAAAMLTPNLIAADDFDYPAGTPLGGQKGGTGWGGPWSAQRTAIGRGSLVIGSATADANGGHAALVAREETTLKRPLGPTARFFDRTKGGAWWFSLLVVHTAGRAGNGAELQLNVFGTDRINDIIRLTLVETADRLVLHGQKMKVMLPGLSSETKRLVGRIGAKPAGVGKYDVTLQVWVNPKFGSFVAPLPQADLTEAARGVKFPARLGVIIQKKSSWNPTTTLLDELRFSRTPAELFK